jgi:hypothetical protein
MFGDSRVIGPDGGLAPVASFFQCPLKLPGLP